MRDFYRILGIPDNATMADIKAAYRRLAKLYHPDLNPGSRHSEEKFKEILDAYTILSDEELRAQYDRKRKIGYTSEPFHTAAPEKKRDPGRKEYPPEYIEMMRQRNRSRIVKQINRRKKILRGMIITFAVYLVGTAVFEAWISKQREEEAAAIIQRLNEKRRTDSVHNAHDVIQNLDSPYDSVFGPARSTWLSPNQLVVINPFSDAVICLMRTDTPHVTIRNEFIHARQTFVMRELPNGTYQVKVYTGEEWSEYLSVPGGRRLGGFSRNEKFFLLNHDAITLLKPTYNNRNTITTDTVRIDTANAQIRLISKEEFFRSAVSQ
jgi:curved DNA-binding protein CbpA